MKRDGACESLWQSDTADYENIQQPVIEDMAYDVLIIGGGITGITTALLLQKQGKRCILAEANTIAFGSTGGTTAHLNNFFDTPYSDVISDFSEDAARQFAQSANEAISFIRQQVDQYNIECSYKERESYLFALDEKQDKILEDIVSTGQQLGLPIDYINDSPFPIVYTKIARVMNQAQFHPVKYVMALASEFEKLGGILVQECRVTNVTNQTVNVAETTKGKIKARHVVYATHIPPGVNLLHFRCAPYRSYAMAVKLKGGVYPEALGYDLDDPYRYYRTQEINGEKYLIAGGEDHKTGHEENTERPFRNLETYLRQWFDIDSVAFRWSSQYYVPADGLPYIGKLPGAEDNIFVATGFNGNGMILGTLSGIIISELITKGEHKYARLFDPSRIKPVAGFSNFVKEAADVIKEFIGGKISSEKIKGLTAIAAGEAKVVSYEGMKIALYKDEQHNLHAVNPTCTHVKCTVGWNAAEKSWDCPCHGARYNCDGVVITGPSQKDLNKISLG